MAFLPRAVYPLILGSALLMFAGGVNGLILPVRGSHEGFSAFALGLLGTGWALGYMSGCLGVPVIVKRVDERTRSKTSINEWPRHSSRHWSGFGFFLRLLPM